MLKRSILIGNFLFFSLFCTAQSVSLVDFNQQRLQKQKTGMLVLGGWALANIAGGIALSSSTNGRSKYFHQMNAGWNTVNLAIAGFGYYATIKTDPASFDFYQSMHEQHKFQKILLFNAGLDVGYMLGGLYLMERSKNTANKPERLEGFGRSIILQGAFLFVFDLVNYAIHAKQNSVIQDLLGSLQFTGDQIGLVYIF